MRVRANPVVLSLILIGISFIFLTLTGCDAVKNPKEKNYIRTYSGLIRIIQEYPNQNCDIYLENQIGWVMGVSLTDCKSANIGDKILIIEKVENGLVEVKVQKLNPNLP